MQPNVSNISVVRPSTYEPSQNAAILNPDHVAESSILTVYLPDKDANGQIINIAYWISATAQLLAHKFGGVTVSSAHRGYWLNPDTKVLVEERTYQVSTFLKLDDLRIHGASVEGHLRRFGQETGQGEVLFQLDNKILRYTQFNSDLPAL